MVEWCWWVSGACIVLAFAATVLGIVWTARPIRPDTDGVPYVADLTGWGAVRGSILLGLGLAFTTLAGLFALLAAPPWLA